ncbi:MAG: NAD(P)/FAD-dependent oxidoreductase, partial [Candidatus Hodarchaeota archaeon]
LVVGGGPAGVIAAFTAVKRDQQVILIDSKDFNEIGNKVCGDFIDLKSGLFLNTKLGIEPPQAAEVEDEIKTLIFKTPNAQSQMSWDGYMIDRKMYGQRLLQEAKNAGVEIRDKNRAVSALYSSNQITGAKVKNMVSGEKYAIKAKVTIDCSGRNFAIRKTLPPDRFPYLEKTALKKDMITSYRQIIRLNPDQPDHEYHHQLLIIIREDVPEPGYFWIFSKGERRLNVGIGWTMNVSAGRPMKEIFQNILQEYYSPNQYVVEHEKGYSLSGRYPLMNAVADGFMTAGDAAFHVNPAHGGGHAPALVAGYYAGKIASDAIISKDTSTEKLWKYNTQIMQYFGLEHALAQLVKISYEKLGCKGFDFVLRRNILSVDDFFTQEGPKEIHLDFLTKIAKVLRLLPRFGIILVLDKISKLTPEISQHFQDYPSHPDKYSDWYEAFAKLIHSMDS